MSLTKQTDQSSAVDRLTVAFLPRVDMSNPSAAAANANSISLVPFQAAFPFQQPVRFRQNGGLNFTNTIYPSSGDLIHVHH